MKNNSKWKCFRESSYINALSRPCLHRRFFFFLDWFNLIICKWSNEFNEKDNFMYKRFIIHVNIAPKESSNFSSPQWYPEETIIRFVRGVIQITDNMFIEPWLQWSMYKTQFIPFIQAPQSIKREKRNMDDVLIVCRKKHHLWKWWDMHKQGNIKHLIQVKPKDLHLFKTLSTSFLLLSEEITRKPQIQC